MLSTGKLLRTSRLLCEVKMLEGTPKCSFHLCCIKNPAKIARSKHFDVLWQKHQPIAYQIINFASTDATGTNQEVEPIIATEDIQASHHIELTESEFSMPDVNSIPPEQTPVTTEAYDNTLQHHINSQSKVDYSSEILEPTNTPELLCEELQTDENDVLEAPIAPEALSAADSLPTPDISNIAGVIPESASIAPDTTATIIENLGKYGGEPAIQTLGLGSWTPVGLVQNSLEFLHVSMDLPWWGAIACGTLVIRIIVFPLMIMAQRNAAKMNNSLPEMQVLQLKMSEARQRGDRLDTARHASELMEFMNKKGVSPFKGMIAPLCQAPFFISMFMGIRGMAAAPVQSFYDGGLWWFTDLTVPDQFYLLPLITSATLALTIEVGTDSAKLNSMGMMKYVLRAMPLVIFPFTLNFPAGVLVYWTATNFISLVQAAILRVPSIRAFFKIEPLLKFDKSTLPIKDKGFVGGIKESWTNMKLSRELEERERLDNSNFLRAGRGAVTKTYKFDPTKPRTPPRSLSSIQLKKRD